MHCRIAACALGHGRERTGVNTHPTTAGAVDGAYKLQHALGGCQKSQGSIKRQTTVKRIACYI